MTRFLRWLYETPMDRVSLANALGTSFICGVTAGVIGTILLVLWSEVTR